MIIHSLKVTGFRIMGKPIELQFPEEGRIGVLGQNESGKTTLLQAIECALYGLKKGSGVEGERENLVTWGKNEANLEIEFTSGQERYVLRRTIGARSGHRATLIQIFDGIQDRKNALSSLTEIEGKIEQITGMDRDSFTKLIYIRQKDLDALKELAKSKREQLVNKVMGIEIFDTATANVKNDINDLQNDCNTKSLQLESVRKNKDQYETKQKQKDILESAISDLKKGLERKKNEVQQAIDLLAKYDWLYSSKTTNEILSSLKQQELEVEKDLKRIAELGEKIKEYETALVEYKPQIETLVSLQAKFSDLERRIEEAQGSVDSIERRRREIISEARITDKELETLSANLPTKKSQRLKGFGVGLVAGIIFLLVGLTINYLFAFLSIFAFVVSAYLFYDYSRFDRLITANAELNTLTKQLVEQKGNFSALLASRDNLAAKTSYKTHDEVNNKLSSILDELKRSTGQNSIEGLEVLGKSALEELEAFKIFDPLKKRSVIQTQILSKEEEKEKLQKMKPISVDDLQYESNLHQAAKETVQKRQQELRELEKNIQTKLGTIAQLDRDLKELKLDYELYPKLDDEVKTYKNRIELLKRVLFELSETSKEMRNKVLPHARYIINQVLPTLTDGRYSDFEITEDLKFKVHSREAGGYKEREIFSGGTQDQFLIALRLAFTQSILDSRVMADKYCLLMDECISSSDEARKQGIFEVLDAMEKTFSQILVIAHEDISSFVDHHIVLARDDDGYAEVRSRSWESV